MKFDMNADKHMGGVITVHKKLVRQSEVVNPDNFMNSPYKTWWESRDLEISRAGWIVGVRYLSAGTSYPPRGHGEDWENGYMDVSSVIPAWQVSFWPSLKPILVPVDGFIKGGVPLSPSKFAWIYKMDPREKERIRCLMHDDMKRYPRDAKGHWMKLNTPPVTHESAP